MIQRIQTIWLLLAALCGFLLTTVPLAVGTLDGITTARFMATESLLVFATAIITSIIGFIAIFLFKNRPLQLKLTTLSILLTIILIGLEIWQIDKFNDANTALKGKYSWGSLFPIAMLIFFIMASSNIKKDEKLIKSLNRLR